MDEKQLHEQLLQAVGEGLQPLREQIESEVKKRGDETAETKQAWDKVNDRIDTLEAGIKRARLDGDRRAGEPSEKKLAYVDWLRKGDDVTVEQKALIVSDDSAGGFLAPDDYVADIIKGIVEFSPLRDVATIRSTTRTNVKAPKRTGTPVAQWVSESGSRSATQQAYGLEEIPTHELSAYVDISFADLEDSAFDVAGEVAADMAEQFGYAEGAAFVGGNGVGRPWGFLNDANVPVIQTASASVLAADDLIETFFAPKTVYQRQASWGLNRQVIKVIRKFKDTTNQYIWQAGYTYADPPTILGAPIVELPDMPNTTTVSQTRIAAFGNFKRAYWIVDRVQFAIQRDPYTQAGVGNVRLTARKRVGGQLVVPEAIVVLKVQ